MTQRAPATATTLFEDDTVRAVRFDFAPGAETGWHIHGHDYTITTLTDCTMLVEEPDGTKRTATFARGASYASREGVKHNVVNGGDAPMSFVEMELKA